VKVFKYCVLAAICIVLMFPVWMMVANSLSPVMGFLRVPPTLMPRSWTFENYTRIFHMPMLGRWILNTAVVAVSVIVVGILVNGAAGYVFAFSKFRGKNLIFWAMLAPLFVTRYVLLISQFQIVRMMHLSGLVGVLSMSIFWPTGIFLFRNYFQGIPPSLTESARMDGAPEWRILLNIVLPVSKPVVGASVVFLGMGALGDFIWQMLLLQVPATKTYIVGLVQSSLNVYAIRNVGYDLAIGTMLFIPYLIIFALSSRYFIEGIQGAIKE
jgi:multiple sugar transport system permease protein